MAYLRKLADDYPSIATVEKIGESYEGRDILMLKQVDLSSGNNLKLRLGFCCLEYPVVPVQPPRQNRAF